MRDDPESFYNGALASDILRDLEKVNGIWTDSDLSGYEHMEREPYQRELSGMKMYLTPPPTSGAVLGLILNILRGRSSRQNVIIIIIFIIVMIIVMIIVIIIISSGIALEGREGGRGEGGKGGRGKGERGKGGKQGKGGRGVEDFYCVTIKFT